LLPRHRCAEGCEVPQALPGSTQEVTKSQAICKDKGGVQKPGHPLYYSELSCNQPMRMAIIDGGCCGWGAELISPGSTPPTTSSKSSTNNSSFPSSFGSFSKFFGTF